MCSNLLVNQTSFWGLLKNIKEFKYDRPSDEKRGQFSTGQNCHRTIAGEYVHFENVIKCKTLQFETTLYFMNL